MRIDKITPFVTSWVQNPDFGNQRHGNLYSKRIKDKSYLMHYNSGAYFIAVKFDSGHVLINMDARYLEGRTDVCEAVISNVKYWYHFPVPVLEKEYNKDITTLSMVDADDVRTLVKCDDEFFIMDDLPGELTPITKTDYLLGKQKKAISQQYSRRSIMTGHLTLQKTPMDNFNDHMHWVVREFGDNDILFSHDTGIYLSEYKGQIFTMPTDSMFERVKNTPDPIGYLRNAVPIREVVLESKGTAEFQEKIWTYIHNKIEVLKYFRNINEIISPYHPGQVFLGVNPEGNIVVLYNNLKYEVKCQPHTTIALMSNWLKLGVINKDICVKSPYGDYWVRKH